MNQTPEIPQNPTQSNFPTGSLYVGDLEPNVTESVLFEVFRKVGPVASIRVCRDSSTRRSLGYAYVNYHRAEDAERAIDTLNYTPITGGRACRIMWSQRDPYIRKSNIGNIYIKDLHPSIQSSDLYDNFSQFGTILSCKVEIESNGNSKGFGYVHFEKKEDALRAIEGVNGIEFEGKKVFVSEFLNKKQRETSGNVPKYTNVYIKNINMKVTEKELKEKFSAFGKITSSVIMYDENKNSKGFGFINFETPEGAKNAVEKMNETEFFGNRLYVAKAQKRDERKSQLKKQFEEKNMKFQDSNLYIKNLDDQIDENKLQELFAKFGKITSVKIMRDENEISKGFGFVCFQNHVDAQNAIKELNGFALMTKPLYVALAQRKEVRTAQLQAQYSNRLGKNMPFNNQFNNNRNYQYNNQYQKRFTNRPNQMQNNYNRQKRNQNQTNQNNNASANNNNYRNNNQTFETPVNQNSLFFQNLNNITDPVEKQRFIGDNLYQSIENFFRTNTNYKINDAGKITGMLLESLDEQELINLIEDHIEMTKKIEEAIHVLEEHMEENIKDQN